MDYLCYIVAFEVSLLEVLNEVQLPTEDTRVFNSSVLSITQLC